MRPGLAQQLVHVPEVCCDKRGDSSCEVYMSAQEVAEVSREAQRCGDAGQVFAQAEAQENTLRSLREPREVLANNER